MADLRSAAAHLHDTMAVHVEKGTVRGVVTALARGDELHVDAIGLPRDTIFRITSMTKPVVAAVTLLLVQDGVLGLDQPVDELLPELADRRVLRDPTGPLDDTVAARRPITVDDLLTFRWGFGFEMEAPADAPLQQAVRELELAVGPPVPPTPHSPDEWLRRLGSLPLMYQPGQRWTYDTGSDVLGVLLARASGRSLPDLLHGRLFAPLGMTDTGFAVPAEQLHRLPPLHSTDDAGTPVVHDAVDGWWSRPPAFPSGAAGLVSTVDDYLAFARMLLSGDLLTPESVTLMTTDRLTPGQRGPMLLGDRGWGYGLSVEDGGRHGWDGGAGTSWFTDPGEGTVALLLTQQMFSGPFMALLADFRTAAGAG